MLDLCESYLDKDGNVQELGKHKKEQIINDIVVNTFAKRALRTLLVAYTDLTTQEYDNLYEQNNEFKTEKDREVLESSLTVAGIFALMDPLRPEIVDSVQKCYSAGIKVRMVTGDNLDTAKAISIEAGIITQEEADI